MASAGENLFSEVCQQQRCRSASDQRLCYSFLGKHSISASYKRSFDFLASLCSCGDWFESHFVGYPGDRFSRDDGPYLMNIFLVVFVLNIIICCTCNICPGAVEVRGHAARKPIFWVSDKASLKLSPRLNMLARKLKIRS